jgi:O-acetyl-ADP-ribose deacetylase (regulator of RNase III)
VRIIFTDTNEAVIEALRSQFYDVVEANFHVGRFEEVDDWECVVSPANSYGIMDGGIDLAIRQFFGMRLQHEVQEMIDRKWGGEQPVGTCEIVDGGRQFAPNRFVAHAPTMRVPQNIQGTLNAFLAMRAMLMAVRAWNEGTTPRSTIGVDLGRGPHAPSYSETTYVPRSDTEERIFTVVCCGLGTLTGRLSPRDAAMQMRRAWWEIEQGERLPRPITWVAASARERWLWAK